MRLQEPKKPGEKQEIPQIDDCTNELIKEWENSDESKKKNKLSKFQIATNFVVNSLDDLIQLIDDIVPDGANKKATVLAAASFLYDKIIFPSLPIWAKPFAVGIKLLIVKVIFGVLIDFIVNKYRNSWTKKEQKCIIQTNQH